MDPNSAAVSLAPNERARNQDAQNNFQSFKKFIVIAVSIAILMTAVVVAQMILKNSRKNTGEIPLSLSDFPTYPNAILSASDNSAAKAEWKIKNPDTADVAMWYAGEISEDDDDKDFEIVDLPDNYNSDNFSFKVKENDKMFTVNFSKEKGFTLVKISDISKNI